MGNQNNYTRKILATLALATIGAGLGTGAAYAAAPDDGGDAPTETVAPDTATDDTCPEGIEEIVFEDDGEFREYLDNLGPDVKAQVLEDSEAANAELIAELDAKGIEYELITDPVTGFEMPGIDATDEAAQQVIDDFIGSSVEVEVAP